MTVLNKDYICNVELISSIIRRLKKSLNFSVVSNATSGFILREATFLASGQLRLVRGYFMLPIAVILLFYCEQITKTQDNKDDGRIRRYYKSSCNVFRSDNTRPTCDGEINSDEVQIREPNAYSAQWINFHPSLYVGI